MTVAETPGRGPLKINHAALDYNGTAAMDGMLSKGVKERIARLRKLAHVYVLAVDTYGTVTCQCESSGIAVRTFPWEGVAGCKEGIVKGLEGGVTCLGNGPSDMQMSDAIQPSIAVLEREGMCVALLSRVSVVVRSIEDGLDLLLRPDRLRATLRS